MGRKMEMVDSNQVRMTAIKAELIECLFKAKAFEPRNQFVNIDMVWYKPSYFKRFSDLLSEYIQYFININEVSCIMSVDNVIYPFGPIPIATLIAANIEKPLGIWKENNDPITGEHKLFGYTPEDGCLILYDVTRFGLTALRMISFMYENRIKPKWFITIIDCDQGAKKILEENAKKIGFDMKFLSILNLKEIVASYTKDQSRST
jgi:orotate phosphoribosyltransferase